MVRDVEKEENKRTQQKRYQKRDNENHIPSDWQACLLINRDPNLHFVDLSNSCRIQNISIFHHF